MLKKEINPLKRGRMQKQIREQKKKSTLGEIFDPFTVLNDSIAAKNCHQDMVPNNYVPSEKTRNAKTTTVDAIDPLLDAGNLSFKETNETRPSRNGNRSQNFRNNSRRNERNSYGGSRPLCNENHRNGNRSETQVENSHSREKPECGIKCLLDKILSFLGFGSRRNKGCGCNKSCSNESQIKSSRMTGRYSNSRNGRNHSRSSQNKFK
jgi:hypothetical protein